MQERKRMCEWFSEIPQGQRVITSPNCQNPIPKKKKKNPIPAWPHPLLPLLWSLSSCGTSPISYLGGFTFKYNSHLSLILYCLLSFHRNIVPTRASTLNCSLLCPRSLALYKRLVKCLLHQWTIHVNALRKPSLVVPTCKGPTFTKFEQHLVPAL